MKYITSFFMLVSSSFSYCQNVDTDEQAFFWTGYPVISTKNNANESLNLYNFSSSLKRL
jgi:hypothetical protein